MQWLYRNPGIYSSGEMMLNVELELLADESLMLILNKENRGAVASPMFNTNTKVFIKVH